MDNPVAGKIGGAPAKPAVQRSPGCIFAIALGMIFLGEIGIMRVLAFFPGLPPIAAAFLDVIAGDDLDRRRRLGIDTLDVGAGHFELFDFLSRRCLRMYQCDWRDKQRGK